MTPPTQAATGRLSRSASTRPRVAPSQVSISASVSQPKTSHRPRSASIAASLAAKLSESTRIDIRTNSAPHSSAGAANRHPANVLLISMTVPFP